MNWEISGKLLVCVTFLFYFLCGGSHWNPSNNKSSQLSSSRLSILADFSRTGHFLFFLGFQILRDYSESSMIDICITLKYHYFKSFLISSWYLSSFRFLLFSLYGPLERQNQLSTFQSC